MDTYEKKYKGALARCKWLLSEGMISKIAATDMFRELMDNDSENIRKEIINIFHSLADGKIPVDINYADIFTWLENIPYTIDHEKREGFHLGYKAALEMHDEQKPAWSEEDERKFSDILALLRGGENCHYNTPDLFDWFKSLRTQNTWKPSDAQMQALKEACDKHWEPDGVDPLYTLYEQLKKLKEK